MLRAGAAGMGDLSPAAYATDDSCAGHPRTWPEQPWHPQCPPVLE
jgi:hypothetical protein